MGRPDPARICTSIVERSNLSLRMGIRRFTRLTNAFSKKWENHWAAVALWFASYNFCRVHRSLRETPAMAARIANTSGPCANCWKLREKKLINSCDYDSQSGQSRLALIHIRSRTLPKRSYIEPSQPR